MVGSSLADEDSKYDVKKIKEKRRRRWTGGRETQHRIYVELRESLTYPLLKLLMM